jgi:plastocyanin
MATVTLPYPCRTASPILALVFLAGAAPAASAQGSAPTGGSGSDQYVTWDSKTNTATFELVAGPFKFDDASNGSATFTVPAKANVVINFVNKDGTPHSAEVISGEGPVPNSADEPAIPRAYTNKVQEGLAQEATDVIRFTAPDSGKFRIFCGVPGHGLSGMWIWMNVDPKAKAASFGPTKS